MNFSKWINTVDTHTEGQPTRIVTGGIGRLPGRTMVEKMEFFQRNLDDVRTLLINEPRGHHDMYGCILTDPCSEQADFGAFFMDNTGYMNMCGHATIGVCTALLETGMVPAREPLSRVALETPGGMVEAMVTFREGRAERVCFRNVAAYVEYLDATLIVPGLGKLKVDVAYGGNYFVFFSGEEAGLRISGDNIKAIIDTCTRVREAANDKLRVRHPKLGNSRSINIATVVSELGKTNPDSTYRNVHVFGTGQFDRSPGGTGTSARLAVLYEKGLVGLNEKVLVESITGGLFTGQIKGETRLGDKRALITEIAGSANITGFHQFVVDSSDRLRHGFLIKDGSDTEDRNAESLLIGERNAEVSD